MVVPFCAVTIRCFISQIEGCTVDHQNAPNPRGLYLPLILRVTNNYAIGSY